MVKPVDLGLGCSPFDPRSTVVKLSLPCISSVFWIAGSTVLVIAAVIASWTSEFKLVLTSLSFLDIWLEISSLINQVVSIAISLFSLLLVLSKDLKSSPITFEFCCSLLDPESKFTSFSLILFSSHDKHDNFYSAWQAILQASCY